MTGRARTITLTQADFVAAGNIRRAAAEAAPAKRIVVRQFDKRLVAFINEHQVEIGLPRLLDAGDEDAIYTLTADENALVIAFFRR